MTTLLSQKRIDNTYYPSFSAFSTEFNHRIEAYNIRPSVYRIPKLAFYMLWYGIERRNLTEIKKYHIGKTSIFDPVSGRDFVFPHQIIDEIRSMADFSLGNPEIIVSDYVLRSRMSGKMTSNTVASAISHFNNVAHSDTANAFQMQPIFESGLFSRIHMLCESGYQFPIYRKNRPLSEDGRREYERLFQRKFSSVQALTTYVNKYRSFVEHFYK